MKLTIFALLLLVPVMTKAQQQERYKIYRLSESLVTGSLHDTSSVTVMPTPYAPTKGELVVLLDTQSGKTWALTTKVVSQKNKVPVLKYSWEPVYFDEKFLNYSTLPH